MIYEFKDFENYRKELFRYTLRKVRSRVLSEDILQNLYINWHSLLLKKEFELKGFPIKILYRALNFHIYNTWYKRSKDYRTLEVSYDGINLENNEEIADIFPEFSSDEILGSIYAKELEQTVDYIKAKCEKKILKKHIAGYDSIEIAKMFNISDSTVRTLITRSRRKLKKYMKLVELREYLISLNVYDSEVILGTMQCIGHDSTIDYIQRRPNGVTIYRSNGAILEDMMKRNYKWGDEWILIEHEESLEKHKKKKDEEN